MELPDLLKGLEDVGSWELFIWGSRWEIPANEIERAVSTIDVLRNQLGISGAFVAVACGALAFGVPPIAGVAGICAAATAAGMVLYELLKARIKAADKGNGVIVDFLFSYGAGQKIFGIAIPIKRNPVSINLSNVRPR